MKLDNILMSNSNRLSVSSRVRTWKSASLRIRLEGIRQSLGKRKHSQTLLQAYRHYRQRLRREEAPITDTSTLQRTRRQWLAEQRLWLISRYVSGE